MVSERLGTGGREETNTFRIAQIQLVDDIGSCLPCRRLACGQGDDRYFGKVLLSFGQLCVLGNRVPNGRYNALRRWLSTIYPCGEATSGIRPIAEGRYKSGNFPWMQLFHLLPFFVRHHTVSAVAESVGRNHPARSFIRALGECNRRAVNK